MRGISFLIAGLVASSGAAAALASGCTAKATSAGAPITLSPSIVVPEGLINDIASLTLWVYSTKSDAGLTLACNPSTGQITGNTNDAAPAEPIAGGLRSESSFSPSCDGGFTRCSADISVPASGTPQIFLVAGITNNVVVATGCATATIDPLTDAAAATAVPVTITLQPHIKAGTCGNGIVEVGETCDTSGQATDPECNPMTCQTSEEILSVGSSSTNTNPSPPAGSLLNPSFSWPVGGTFVASFTDKASVLGSTQVDLRIMGPTLGPATGAGAADSDEFILPNTSFPSQPAGDNQQQPQSVQLNGTLFTVFADDFPNLPDNDIHLRETILSTLTNAETNPCGINGTSGDGETGAQASPGVAQSGGNLFIVWQGSGTTGVAGRMYTPAAGGGGACGTLGPQISFGSGQSGSASVAAIASGWVVAWQSGTAVQMQLVNSTGSAIGGTTFTTVSTGTGSAASPNVGALPDGGGFAVAWADTTTGNILAQRYTVTVSGGAPTATAIAGDQAASGAPNPVNNLIAPGTGDPESTPFVTGSTVGGGFYVVTWVDSKVVHARLLAGTAGTLQDPSGYLFNGITGLADEFQVSSATSAGHTHASPTAAVGGGNGLPFIAFGWADTSTGGGIIARRFPIPSQTPWE